MELLVGLGPFEIIEPLRGVWLFVNLTRGACKEESPLFHINFVVTKQDFCAE